MEKREKLHFSPRRSLVDRQATLPVAAAGFPSRTEPLFQTLYSDLHRMARCELARRGSDLSIGVTSLLHEAWLNMAALGERASFSNRASFMAYSAQVMRRLIVDYARERHALKRGDSRAVARFFKQARERRQLWSKGARAVSPE